MGGSDRWFNFSKREATLEGMGGFPAKDILKGGEWETYS